MSQEQEAAYGIPPLGDPQPFPSLLDQIQELRNTTPSDPEDPQSTIDYCNRGLNLGSQLIRGIIAKHYPIDVDQVDKLDAARTAQEGLTGQFIETAGKLYFETEKKVAKGTQKKQVVPVNSNDTVDGIMHALANSDPDLGVPDYVRQLDLRKIGDRPGYDHFTYDFNRVRRLASSDDQHLVATNDSRLEIIATAYVTQIAKNSAVERTKQFIDRAIRLHNQFDPQSSQYNPTLKPEGFINDVVEKSISPIRRDETYILRGKHAIEEIQKRSGISVEQLQVLLDLAFINPSAFAPGNSYQNIVQPIAQYAFADNWEQAIIHRDYALKFFAGAFPEWRRTLAAQQQQIFAATFPYEAAHLDLINHAMQWDIEGTPESYRGEYVYVMHREDIEGKFKQAIDLSIASAPLSSRLLKTLTADLNKRILIVKSGSCQGFYESTDTNVMYHDFGEFLFQQISGQSPFRIGELAQVIADEYATLRKAGYANFSIDHYIQHYIPRIRIDRDAQLLLTETTKRLERK